VQFSKQHSPIDFTVLGMMNLVNEEQPKKHRFRIIVNVFGRLIIFNDEQL
jgi:hypothetical protein